MREMLECIYFLHNRGIIHQNLCKESVSLENKVLKITGFIHSRECFEGVEVIDDVVSEKTYTLI